MATAEQEVKSAPLWHTPQIPTRGAPMPLPEIPSVLEFLGQPLLDQLDAEAEPTAVPGLRVGPGLRAAYPQLLTDEALAFIVALAERTRPALNRVLAQRRADRAWLDAETLALAPGNTGRDFSSSAWQTVIGRATPEGRVLVGPLPPQPAQPVQVPAWLAGDQVTLFGPPDSKRLSINAMNALHRRLPEEPPIVARLVDESGQVPRWGADDEDSKTPLALDLLAACDNLLACFDGSLSFTDPASGREYRLATERRARPVKRIPGLELPDTRLLLRGCPLPLHLSDLALHAWHARSRPEALTFYVPKLENEGEAEYLRQLLGTCEELLRQAEPDLAPGTLRVILVFENPRAIFRVREMAQALHPHFVGGSLGWHDFLASTARLFRHDPGYRIPVKADPDIVIRHIKESHLLLAHTLGPLGALRIGGMYGVLYEDGNPRSFALSMVGYIRDVVTQLRRGLDGFWVAHPAFVSPIVNLKPVLLLYRLKVVSSNSSRCVERSSIFTSPSMSYSLSNTKTPNLVTELIIPSNSSPRNFSIKRAFLMDWICLSHLAAFCSQADSHEAKVSRSSSFISL